VTIKTNPNGGCRILRNLAPVISRQVIQRFGVSGTGQGFFTKGWRLSGGWAGPVTGTFTAGLMPGMISNLAELHQHGLRQFDGFALANPLDLAVLNELI